MRRNNIPELYKIVYKYDRNTVLETAVIIDHAIHRAKKLSQEGEHSVEVWDGSRVRVFAAAGKAWWLTTCKACKGNGTRAVFMQSTECSACKGWGVLEDGAA